jgi:hypothetical protein
VAAAEPKLKPVMVTMSPPRRLHMDVEFVSNTSTRQPDTFVNTGYPKDSPLHPFDLTEYLFTTTSKAVPVPSGSTQDKDFMLYKMISTQLLPATRIDRTPSETPK